MSEAASGDRWHAPAVAAEPMSKTSEGASGVAAPYRYWAFISYSHRDAEWGRWLHSALESYRVPRGLVGRPSGDITIPRRLFPVFRDRDELPSADSLNSKIREALGASSALIVVCSPYAALSPWVNEEIRIFRALGRGRRIFPLIVDGEPFASEHPELALPECFAPALRYELDPDGTLSDRRTEPIAADARDGKDGRTNALLKLAAGVLGVGFNDLRRRELIQQRRRQRLRIGAAVAAWVAICLGYIALADTGLAIPGGEVLRRQLDRNAVTLFRPVQPPEAVARAAADSRARLRRRMTDALRNGEYPRQDYKSVWEVAQIAAAIYRDPDATSDDLGLTRQLLDRELGDDRVLLRDGRPIGWKDTSHPRVEASLWLMMGLAQMQRRAATLDGGERQKLAKRLALAQEMADAFYPLDDGGWNMAVEEGPAVHVFYDTALALHALLDLRSAGLCWRGKCDRLEKMSRDTAGWLIQNFVDEQGLTGWRRDLIDDKLPDPEISLITYGALGRAQLELSVRLPARLQAAAFNELARLNRRPYFPSATEAIRQANYTDSDGRRLSVALASRVMWYPWSIDAVRHWRKLAERQGVPPEVLRALDRSNGHLLVDLAPDMLSEMFNARTLPFVWAETNFGLGAAN